MLLEGVLPRERQRLAREVMERLNLSDRAHHQPGQLSGGQRQRVAIARAIVMRPSLLLADEPTGNLDSRSGSEVMQLLEELNHSGITLLVVTHDPNLGGRAQRHIRMVDGKIADDTSGDHAPG
jgi:putative ABC transport system ATP-binding protein